MNLGISFGNSYKSLTFKNLGVQKRIRESEAAQFSNVCFSEIPSRNHWIVVISRRYSTIFERFPNQNF